MWLWNPSEKESPLLHPFEIGLIISTLLLSQVMWESAGEGLCMAPGTSVCVPWGDLHILCRKRETSAPREYVGLCWGSYCAATVSLRSSIFGKHQLKWSEKKKKANTQILKKSLKAFPKELPLILANSKYMALPTSWQCTVEPICFFCMFLYVL